MFPKINNKSGISLNIERASSNFISLKNQLLMSPALMNANSSFYNNNSNYNINIFSRNLNDSFYNNKNKSIQNQFDNTNTNRLLSSYKKEARQMTQKADDMAKQIIKTEGDQRQPNNGHRRKRVLVKSLDFNESTIFSNSQQYEQIIQSNQQNTQNSLNIVQNIDSLNKLRPLQKKIIQININDQQLQDKLQLEQSSQSEKLIPHYLSVNSDSVMYRKSSFQGFAIAASSNQKPLIQNNSQTLIQSVKQISQSSIFSNRSNSSKQTQCSISYIPSDSEKNITESPISIPCLEKDNQIRSSEIIQKQLDKPLIQNALLVHNTLKIKKSSIETPEEVQNCKQESQKNVASEEKQENFYNFLSSDKKKNQKSFSLKGILKYSSQQEIDVKQIRSIKKRVSFSKVKEYF